MPDAIHLRHWLNLYAFTLKVSGSHCDHPIFVPDSPFGCGPFGTIYIIMAYK